MKLKYLWLLTGLFGVLAETAQAQVDQDNNGLSDIWEKLYSVQAGPLEDSDQDGHSNLDESHSGTNPNDAASHLAILQCRLDPLTGEPIICFLAQPGKRYSIDQTSHLERAHAEWNQVKVYDHQGPVDRVEIPVRSGTHDSQSLSNAIFFRLQVSELDLDEDGVTAWEEHVIGTTDGISPTPPLPIPDYDRALAWLAREVIHTEDEDGDDEPIPGDGIDKDQELSADVISDTLFDLFYFVKEEADEAKAEFPASTALGQLVQQFDAIEEEERVVELINQLNVKPQSPIYSEILELVHEEDNPEDPLLEAYLDLYYFVQEEPIEALNEFPSDSPIGSLIRKFQDLSSEDEAIRLVEGLPTTTRADIETELQRLEDENAREEIPDEEGGEPSTGVKVYFPAGIKPPVIPPLPQQSERQVSLKEAARFLTQATLGSDYETIEMVSKAGLEAWIDYQFDLPKGYHLEANQRLKIRELEGEESADLSPYRWTWWEQVMKSPDVLRQRIAFALSEILVVSDLTDVLEDSQWALASYYDLLIDGAFGNYRDTLMRVSKHSVMGHWLSHAKNQPTDLTLNRFPDENYAREVMQLFSIGLFELNQDGTKRTDASGNAIPTYDNRDITELAKVFTGLTFNPIPPRDGTPVFDDDELVPEINSVEDYLAVEPAYLSQPMWPYEPMHEQGPKTILGQRITGGTIQQDLDAAIDILFHHPNTGPFIGYRLIQRLVTSNPSPNYISRVAAAFNDNGEGIRGDMKAVVKAILLDPEARDRSKLADPTWGMLREPYVRYVHLCRAFNARSQTGAFRNTGEASGQALGQLPMHAPSVFNFFLPDHQPLGPIAEAGLVAPEFQITTATTSVATINFWGQALDESLMSFNEDLLNNSASLTLDDEIALADDLPALVDRLDLLLTHGELSSKARAVIIQALQSGAPGAGPEERVRFAIYLFLNSPDFAVLR